MSLRTDEVLNSRSEIARVSNAIVLACLAAALGAGLIVQPPAGGADAPLTIFGFALPGVCSFRRLTGIPCAGCGLTRSVVLLLHGRLADSLAAHPFGPIVMALALLQIPPRLSRALGRGEAWTGRWDRLWAVAAVLTLILMLAWWALTVPIRGWIGPHEP